MNFCQALQHAFIGYGISRTAWGPDKVIYFDDNDHNLRFAQSGPQDAGRVWNWSDVSHEDLNATDWESI